MPAKTLTKKQINKIIDQLTVLNCLGQLSKNKNLEICITHLIFEIGATLQIFGDHCQPFSAADFDAAFEKFLGRK